MNYVTMQRQRSSSKQINTTHTVNHALFVINVPQFCSPASCSRDPPDRCSGRHNKKQLPWGVLLSVGCVNVCVFFLYFVRYGDACACVRACGVERKNGTLPKTQRPRMATDDSNRGEQFSLGLAAKFSFHVSIFQSTIFYHDAWNRKRGIQISTFHVRLFISYMPLVNQETTRQTKSARQQHTR